MNKLPTLEAFKILGSAGCQPAAFGSLPNESLRNPDKETTTYWRQAAANGRLAACAPQKQK